MADVLLTHSYHLPYDRKQLRKMQPYPPLGTLYAASFLRAHGMSVAVFDTMLQDPSTGFPEAIRVHRPRIVAIYEDDFNFLSKMCLTRMRQVAWEMAETAHSMGARVFAHGSDASDHPEEYLRNGVDFVLLGEAEATLYSLASAVLARGSTGAVGGVVHLGASRQVLRTPAAHLISDWANIPAPARDLIEVAPYRDAWIAAHGYFSLNLVASRGCPYRCNWCAKPISGSRFHVRPAQDVAMELRELKESYGADHAWFGDDVFALNRQWARQFAHEIRMTGSPFPFKIQSRADLMTPETVDALRLAGCAEVWMGVESGSQRILDAMDKGLLVSEVIAARNRLKDAGIRACYFLQLGYPGEGWREIQETIALVRETRPDDIGVSVSYPLPSTPFYERVRTELGRKRNWTDSDDLCVIFKGAYTDDFYRAIRDALHAEVDSWNANPPSPVLCEVTNYLWTRVNTLEPISRNPDATYLPHSALVATSSAQTGFVPVTQLIATAREV